MAGQAPGPLEPSDASGLRVALVVARFNASVTSRLRDGAQAALQAANASAEAIIEIPVPGAFEIPQAAAWAASSGRFDAVVCLGCVIRGETAHFEYIASAVAHGIMTAATASGVPMTLGVLTTDTLAQALARAGDGASNKGWEAAEAAISMARLSRRLSGDGPGAP